MANKGHYRRVGGTRQGIYVCSPSGILLNSVNSLNPDDVLKMIEIGLDKWNSLPKDLQKIVETSAKATTQRITNEMIAGNNLALETLVKKHKIKLKPFPENVLKELANLSDIVIKKLIGSDKLSKEVYNSIMNFREKSIMRSQVSEQKFLETRLKFS